MSFVQAPPNLVAHPLLKSLPPSTFLPAELLDILNHTYFLHLLATDSSKVVPPGKSILSILTQSHVQAADPGIPPALQAQVEEVVHKAFWDVAYEALSSPESGVQLERLKSLYGDLHEALKHLLPSGHRVITTLSSPFEPTSAPLLSAVIHLREILVALRQRCAPVRDAHIDGLLNRLMEPPPAGQTAELARLVVDSIRDMLKLSAAMKDDLSQFVLGTLSEAELRDTISSEAHARERGLILDLWKTRDRIASPVSGWVSELSTPYSGIVTPPGRRWVARLMQALAAPTPVACPLPTKPVPTVDVPDAEAAPPPPNTLPPPFFFSAPALENAQNILQALVILAALRALFPPGAPTAPDFTTRVWALLEPALASAAPTPDDTKLANLADELLRARGAVEPDEAARVRAAVARTLHVADPAFALLQRRLVIALMARLVQVPQPRRREDLPAVMRTGRHRHDASAGVDAARLGEEEAKREWDGFVVKGFEDAVVMEKVREAGARLRRELQWIERVWSDELKSD